MPSPKGSSRNTAALAILGFVSIACFGYAWIGGEDGRLPLTIAGVVGLTMIALLYRSGDSSEE